MSVYRVVTVRKKVPLFKGAERANSVELIELVEVGNTIVSQIGLYQVGDKVVFIEPDYCLPDNEMFSEYYRPGGDEKRCKLGSHGRIKAVKFNLHTGNNLPVYSYGIILPLSTFVREASLLNISNPKELDKDFGITKWEEPESPNKGANLGDGSKELPEGMYKTDETNINNLWRSIQYPITLVGSMKVDGSSITIFDNEYKSGICSRNYEVPLTTAKCIGVRERTWLEKLMFWIPVNADRYKIYETKESDSEFIKVGKPYLEELEKYCKDHSLQLALRGELNGQGLRGSGNKNNPSTKEVPNIKFYAVDSYDNGITIRLGEEEFDKIITELGFTRCKKYFQRKMRCKSDIIRTCEAIFKKEAAKGNIIEGIVLKSLDGIWSAKLMNMEYDSKK